MLVLSRKVNEVIAVPSVELTFRIIEIRGNTVRVGIEAPRSVTIVREELLTLEATAEKQEPDASTAAHSL